MGGIRGSGELQRLVTSSEGAGEAEWTVAFCMFPVSVDQVMRVADAEQLMPPKVTRGSFFRKGRAFTGVSLWKLTAVQLSLSTADAQCDWFTHHLEEPFLKTVLGSWIDVIGQP